MPSRNTQKLRNREPRSVVCDYCKQPAVLKDSSAVYERSYGPIWHCAPCRAWVGVHRNSPTHAPLGRLANAELRHLKQRAHAAFDRLWKDGPLRRNEAYRWLSEELGIPLNATHIGMFDPGLCIRTIILIRSTPQEIIMAAARKATKSTQAAAEKPNEAADAAPSKDAEQQPSVISVAGKEIIATNKELVELSFTQVALQDLEKRLGNLVYPDLDTPKGIDRAKKDVAELRTLRTSLDKKRLELNKPDHDRIKRRNALAEGITEAIELLEKPLKAQLEAEENRREAIRIENENKERERIAGIRQKITTTFAMPPLDNLDSAGIAGVIDRLSVIVIGDEYAELQHEAAYAKDNTLTLLRSALAAAQADEANAAERARQLEEDRLLNERLAAKRRELAELEAKATAISPPPAAPANVEAPAPVAETPVSAPASEPGPAVESVRQRLDDELGDLFDGADATLRQDHGGSEDGATQTQDYPVVIETIHTGTPQASAIVAAPAEPNAPDVVLLVSQHYNLPLKEAARRLAEMNFSAVFKLAA